MFTCLIVAYCACAVSGYDYFRNDIPNGHTVPHPCNSAKTWDGVGHQTQEGGTARNPFGLDWKDNGQVWNSSICEKDSDGDGRTNGQELGDPDCTWTIGTNIAAVASSHPGICEPIRSAMCANKNSFLDCGKQGFQCDAINQPDVFNISISFAPGTRVPRQETTYMCQAFDLPEVATSSTNHLIAAIPNIVNPTVAHHMIIRGCSSDAHITDQHRAAPYMCFMGDQIGCDDIIAIWAVGSPGVCLPDEIGFAVGVGGYKQVLFEIHWDNQLLLDSYVDNSGFILFLTPNKRANDAGILMIGQDQLRIPPLQPAFDVSGRCSGTCLDFIYDENYEEFKIAGAFNHAHLTGSAVVTQVYDPATGGLTDLARDTTYDFNAPIFYIFDKAVSVRRGQELNVTCTYNTMSRTQMTYYGEGTRDEMCFSFLLYYPKESLTDHQCSQKGQTDKCLDVLCGPEQELEFGARVWTACSLFECLDTCKAVAMEADKNPCFSGNRKRAVLENASTQDDVERAAQVFEFFVRLDSCRTEMAMDQCRDDQGVNSGINVAVSTYVTSIAVVLTAMVAHSFPH
ncbi:dopamine beta-hydroxylase-like isoform X2 [Mya arenaria]|uniref:dopamine beta-hydroxylase-like isoform X2 n=1 Tax=Mya arenaria TaxID=6604 RepID=UPI0022E5A255|nr:dopamine beta-hydroxylase-like isoform X2 [Mya arenaria]